MADHDVDLFVIGAGSGGVRAARVASSYGARVMIAEEYRVGGTCVIRGCVPKKLLVYASRFSDEFEDAAGYGWTVPEPTFHWPTLIANKDREIARLEAAYTATLERFNVELVKSRAVLEDAHTVRLASGARVRAETILIATGAWPLSRRPRFAGLEHVISSNEAFHLKQLPKRILIQGGGYIAVEFAGIFAGLGSAGDAGLSRREYLARLRRRCARAFAQRNGAARHHGYLPARPWQRSRRWATTSTSSCPTTSTIMADQVMFAIGRTPNVMGLGLESGERQDSRERRHRGRCVFDAHRCRISTRSATSPTGQSHAGGDPRRPCLRRHGLWRQADAGRSHQCADRGVLRARSRRHRPDRSARRASGSPRSTSTRPASGR